MSSKSSAGRVYTGTAVIMARFTSESFLWHGGCFTIPCRPINQSEGIMTRSATTKPHNRLTEGTNGKQPATKGEVEKLTKVKTKKGLPDMRIREHRQAFMYDPNARTDGRPDERKLVNRTDLQALHEARGEDKPNLIFTQDGELRD